MNREKVPWEGNFFKIAFTDWVNEFRQMGGESWDRMAFTSRLVVVFSSAEEGELVEHQAETCREIRIQQHALKRGRCN